MKKRRIKTKILYIILILQVILLLITGKNINTFNGLFIIYYIQLYFIYKVYKEIERKQEKAKQNIELLNFVKSEIKKED